MSGACAVALAALSTLSGLMRAACKGSHIKEVNIDLS